MSQDAQATPESAAEAKETKVLHVGSDKSPESTKAGEMSVGTIARLMGIATATDMQVLEGKIDLLFSKVNAMAVRVEKTVTVLNNAPSGSDLERIDVQIGSLKAMLRDFISGQDKKDSPADKKGKKAAQEAEEASPAADPEDSESKQD